MSLQVNLYLISQLEFTGLCAIFGYIGVAMLVYSYNLRTRNEPVQHFSDEKQVEKGIMIEPPQRMISMPETG